ncbi:MAG: helix-turn-helix domain-containing protein [Acidimicrobiia bacterium]|nr:helix-turn-helix domain-containing protein [Acidimicrobiia bacterium]
MSDSIEQRFHDLGEFIREQRHNARLSMRKLSELAGISNPYLSQIERGLRKPSAEILQQIAHGLRISAETLYVRAGFLEQRDEATPDLEHEIRRDPTLSDRQKSALLEVYRSFQSEQPSVPGGPASDIPVRSERDRDVEQPSAPERDLDPDDR